MTTSNGEVPTIEQLQAELEKVRNDLKAANSEAAARRIKIKELEDAQAGKLSEAEQLRKDLEVLKQQRAQDEAEKKQRKIQDAIVAKAKELGFENPEDAMALIGTSKVEITDDGAVKGFEAELDALAKSNRLPMKGAIPAKKGTLILPKHQAGGVEEKTAPIPSNLTRL